MISHYKNEKKNSTYITKSRKSHMTVFFSNTTFESLTIESHIYIKACLRKNLTQDTRKDRRATILYDASFLQLKVHSRSYEEDRRKGSGLIVAKLLALSSLNLDFILFITMFFWVRDITMLTIKDMKL
ncbi:hypothetical protein V6Z11_A10G131600 [Gossypium hirsutum]